MAADVVDVGGTEDVVLMVLVVFGIGNVVVVDVIGDVDLEGVVLAVLVILEVGGVVVVDAVEVVEVDGVVLEAPIVLEVGDVVVVDVVGIVESATPCCTTVSCCCSCSIETSLSSLMLWGNSSSAGRRLTCGISTIFSCSMCSGLYWMTVWCSTIGLPGTSRTTVLVGAMTMLAGAMMVLRGA